MDATTDLRGDDGRDVSCRAFGFMLDSLSKNGVDWKELLAEVPIDPDLAQTPDARISWTEFAAFLDRVEQRVGEDHLVEVGREFPTSTWTTPFRMIAGTFADTDALFRWIVDDDVGPGHTLFRCVRSTARRTGPLSLEIDLQLEPGFRGCRAFFRITQGAMSAIPRLFDADFAAVQVDINASATMARYVVQFGPDLFDRLRATPSEGTGRAVEEALGLLRRRHIELQEQFASLAAAERKLRDSEEAYRNLIETAPEAIITVDPSTLAFLEVNRAAITMFRTTRDTLLTRGLLAVSAPTQRGGQSTEEFAREFVDRAVVIEPQVAEWSFIAVGGEDFVGEVRMATYLGTEGLLVRMSIVDVSERSRLLAELQRSRNFLDLVLNAVPDPIFVKDAEGRYVTVNDAFSAFVGRAREDVLGRGDDDVFGRGTEKLDPERDQEVLRTGKPLASEETIVDPFGVQHIVSVKRARFRDAEGRPVVVGTVHDLTERRRVEQTLRRAQKLESLGVLAGGVAHDFNNLLVAMHGQSLIARQKVDDRADVRVHLDKVIAAVARASELTRQMLVYAGKETTERRNVDLNRLVTETVSLFAATIPPRVELQLDLHHSEAVISVDPGQLQQVVMNLVINAAESIPGAGRVWVSSELIELDAKALAIYTDFTGVPLEPGAYVILCVADDGTGMSEETIARIFDPFFTTKFTGRGLGLAATLGILRSHGGGLRVHSALGRGTVFEVVFPLVERPKLTRVGHSQPHVAARPERHEGVILVVDDEAPVRETVVDLLDFAGFDTVSAADGDEALRVFGDLGGRISLVILDLSMPGRSGVDTYAALRTLDSVVPVILSSGYTQESVAARLVDETRTFFVKKPWSGAALIDLVTRHRRAFDRSKPA
jgi:PAS domain S-box-containing protein